MNILALTRYSRLGASSRVRFYQFLPILADHGISVVAAPLLSSRYLLSLYAGQGRSPLEIIRAFVGRMRILVSQKKFDLVWLEKELFPWLPGRVERLLLSGRVPYLVDYDDATFHTYDLASSAVLRILFEHKIDHVMRGASVVTVGNDYIGDHARMAGARRVEKISSSVDYERYRKVIGKTAPNTGPFSIGWIGTPSSLRYLESIRGPLQRFCNDFDAKLILIGTENMVLEGVPTDIHPWSEETEVGDLNKIDVGIMPLIEEPWSLGKCAYKIVQYMACAKPVVASGIGANLDIVRHGENGFIVNSESEWYDYLKILWEDRNLCVSMGQAGLSDVQASYSRDAIGLRLVRLFEDLV